LLKNPFSATHIVVYRVPETFVAHCTWWLHRVCNYQVYIYICWLHRCPGKNNPVSSCLGMRIWGAQYP
jgi:hypothetical protein